jgi:pimeloyl-ACP methyl ester carboxylesterase
MTADPQTLVEAWTILDGRPLLYRTNADPPSAGAPTIIHLHGFAISGRYLLPTASRLAGDHATFVPDLPGFGRSHRPPKPLTIDELAEATVRFMDDRGIDRAILLGNSLGCLIIGSVLARHADRVETAILVSPAGGRYNQPLPKGLGQMAVAGTREPLGMVPIAMVDYAHYGLFPSLRLARSMLAYPTLERIRELVLPTLIVIGSRDPLVNETRIATTAVELPHITAVVINGAAHAINYSHPEQLAHVVRCFLEDRPIVGDPAAKGTIRVFRTPDPADPPGTAG